MRRIPLRLAIPLGAVAIFWLCLWGLAYYASSALRADLRQVLAEQQYSMVNQLASQIEHHFQARIVTLQAIAGLISDEPILLADRPALLRFLAGRPATTTLFSGGVMVIGRDGHCLADYPALGRTGRDYGDRGFFEGSPEGRPLVSPIVLGRTLNKPTFGVSVPIRDGGGRQVAVLIGVMLLPDGNFLNDITEDRLAPAGSLLIVSPRDHVTVMATDRSRVMRPVPAPGTNLMHDRYMSGFEGSGVTINHLGIEELTSGKRLPTPGWFLAAALPTAEAFAPVDRLQRRIYLAALAASLLVGVVVSLTTRRLLGPLAEATGRISAMLTGTVPLGPLPAVGGGDEVGALVTSFNALQDKIHQGERQLRDSEQRYRALFDLAPDAVLVHADGVIRLANPFAARLLGAASPESLVGKALASLILPGQPGEQTLQRLDGASVAADLTTSAIAFGDQTATMVIARDISARKTIEQTLVRQDEELKRSNAELEQFAYVASHDLREPLRMVSSYVALLERRFADKLDADGRDFIAFAKDGAQRMDRLILDLLEYSRIGRRSQPSSQVPLAQAVAEALANLEVAVADAGASVTVAKDLPAVMGDSDELMRLFQNLIGNALKYRSPDRPAVVGVTCRRDGDDWLLAVTDNGIGIDADSLERVFGIFQRLHARSQFEGTGIGLAICRKIVERHGGRIWVQSVPGQGSEFLFRLPVA